MATLNFSFLELSGSEKAGHNTINALINDIDDKLDERVTEPGMVIIYEGGAAPPGWSNFTASMTSSGVTLPPGHIWIKKDAI